MTRLRILGFALVAVVSAVWAISAMGASGEPGNLPPQKAEPLPSCRPKNYGEGEATIRRNAKSRSVLVPSAPTTVLLCRYWGFGDLKGHQTPQTQARAGKLASERRLTRQSLVRLLARGFDQGRGPGNGSYNCPSDDGSNIVSEFAYADEPNVVVETSIWGCGFSTNGFGNAAFTLPWVHDRLLRLTRTNVSKR
jgi:hypothetical protein